METLTPPIAPPPAEYPRGAPEPRRLPAGEGVTFWSEAWRIFSAAPGVWILILIVYVAIAVVLGLIPVVGNIAHIVLTPVFTGGAMLGCHALARGEPLTLGHLFAGFQDRRFGPLAVLGLMLLALTILFGIVMFFGLLMTFGMSGLSALSRQSDPLAFLGAIGGGFFALVAIGLVGGFLIAMAYWFAPALVVLNGEEPLMALRKSFSANVENVGAFLIYGLIYIGLAILATMPLGLGWIVLAPMIVGSCYAGWRQIFGH